MLQKSKPKTAAGHRAMKRREPVEEEDAKKIVFLKGTNTSMPVTEVMKDLLALKKPDSITFTKRNDIHPFEDHKQLEFYSLKNDAPLFCFGSHSKKRPDNIVLARMFDYQLLDMCELGIMNHTPASEFKTIAPPLGSRPLMAFKGEHWDSSDELRTIKSIFQDCFTGNTHTDKIDLNHGLSHVMVFTLIGSPKDSCRILLNVYNVILKKSDNIKYPKVELEETGPYVEFVQRRTTLANTQTMKDSLRVPKLNTVIILINIRPRNRRILKGMNSARRAEGSGWTNKIFRNCRLER